MWLAVVAAISTSRSPRRRPPIARPFRGLTGSRPSRLHPRRLERWVPERKESRMDNTDSRLMTALIDAGNIDTVYRDVYLDRARILLAPVVSLEDFHRLEQQCAALAELPAMLERALDKGNWSLVKELTQRAQVFKHAIEDKGAALQTARGVYNASDVRLDPFSPGL